MRLDRPKVVELIYGTKMGRRFTQDSPILPDVWIEYAALGDSDEPGREPVALLITPYQWGSTVTRPGELSRELEERLAADHKRNPHDRSKEPALIAYNQATVVANLTLGELVRVVLPLSKWWSDRICKRGAYNLLDKLGTEPGRAELRRAMGVAAEGTGGPEEGARTKKHLKPIGRGADGAARPQKVPPDVLWLVRVLGTLLLAQERESRARDAAGAPARRGGGARAATRQPAQQPAGGEWPPGRSDPEWGEYVRRVVERVARLLVDLPWVDCKPMAHSVTLNRVAASTVNRSKAAVKADAATRLFNLSCADLTWAIVDSGIDAEHPAFRSRAEDGRFYAKPYDADGRLQTRVVNTYDFSFIRYLLSADPQAHKKLPAGLQRKLRDGVGKELRVSLNSGREIDWPLLSQFIEVPHREGEYQVPRNEHGTHVAGILAADWWDMEAVPQPDSPPAAAAARPRRKQPRSVRPEQRPVEVMRGVCPDLKLYDLRVLNDDGEGDEFTVMAALQFIRHLNAHKDYVVVHGANLSLSIRHDVANYACGRTPVCEECERLIGAGLVVVAAAGNEGHLAYMTSDGLARQAYQDISITDPGNAEAVITVGATHRDSPHTYGVSYFSSRGPTGDGRIKPDLVAPGEKIEGPVPGEGRKVMDGTSMAAPHVSGAAALLIARHRELAGRPVRVKQILCGSTTDLGRQRYFQGAGMLDVLRAIQAV